MGKVGDIGRQNALGVLRLAFAILVIVSHSVEMADGNRSREPLTRLFGTISFGELAVDAFFVISGYLIVASYMASDTVLSYLKKRCIRIYPGFIVASLISLLVVAPLVGGSWPAIIGRLPYHLSTIAALQYLEIPGTFPGLGFSDINGAVWTIAYEFRCYLLVIALGLAGIFRRPAIVAAAAVSMMAAYVLAPDTMLRNAGYVLPFSRLWMGWLDVTLRLTSLFLVGSCFYLWRDRIVVSVGGAVIAAVGLLIALCFAPLAELGVGIFGGYLIFAFALWGRGTILSRINNRDDISYGTYLYGWPIGAAILWAIPALPLWSATMLAILASTGAGWASWRLVEKPAIRWSARR